MLLRTPGMTTTSPGPQTPLFGAEAKLHLAVEHPNDLLICVTMRLDIDAAPIAVSSLHAAALCAAVSQARAEFRECYSPDERLQPPRVWRATPRGGGPRGRLSRAI